MATYKFIVNDENVNEYGYRVLSSGIDHEQYMRNPVVLFLHKRNLHDPKGTEVIGKCINLSLEGTQLIAEIEFDEADEFAKAIAGKVERGFIRMASISADTIESSVAPEYLVEGQKYETVTKCKLEEISIVDIGGNDNALRLSKDGKPVQLKKITESKNKNEMIISKIALAMGMDESTQETLVLESVKKLKLAKDKAEKRATDAETSLGEIRDAEAVLLTDKAIELGLISEGLKTIQLGAFKGDHDGTKVTLSKLISDKEAEIQLVGGQKHVKEVVLNADKSKKTGESDAKETYDYLQKHDHVKLAKIREDQPEQYKKIAKEYEQGVRYKE